MSAADEGMTVVDGVRYHADRAPASGKVEETKGKGKGAANKARPAPEPEASEPKGGAKA